MFGILVFVPRLLYKSQNSSKSISEERKIGNEIFVKTEKTILLN